MGLMFPAGPLCPHLHISVSPLGLCKQSVPQLQHSGSGGPSTASHSTEQGAHTKASLRKCASCSRSTSTARTSPRGLC